MSLGYRFHVGEYILKPFSELFLKNNGTWTSKWYPTFKEMLSKTTLETNSTKHAKHVAKLMPSDLRKTICRIVAQKD